MTPVESLLCRHGLHRFSNQVRRIHTNMSSDSLRDRGFKGELDELVLSDGRRLNRYDPAVLQLIKVIDGSHKLEIRTLNDLLRGLHDGIRPAWHNDIAPEHHEEIDELFAMKASGGWGELDRLSCFVLGEPMTMFVDREASRIGHDVNDQSLGGSTLYVLAIQSLKRVTTPVAFGSTAVHALNFLGDLEAYAGDSLKGEEGFIQLRKNKNVVFEIPFKPLSREATNNYGVYLQPFYSMEKSVGWKEVDWLVDDPLAMKALAAVAPNEVKHVIKGRFLQDGLGM